MNPNPDHSALLKKVQGTFAETEPFRRRPSIVSLFHEILEGTISQQPVSARDLANKFYSSHAGTLWAAISSLKRVLASLYATEWRSHRERIVVEWQRWSGYTILVEENKQPITSPLDYFWGRFLNDNGNLLYISEPLFWQKEGQELDTLFYARNPRLNQTKDKTLLYGVVVQPKLWNPIVYYAKLSEVLSAFTLLHALTFRTNTPAGRGKRKIDPPKHFIVELATPSLTPNPDVKPPYPNLIVFGNPRINHIFEAQQADLKPPLYFHPVTSKITSRASQKVYRDRVSRTIDENTGELIRTIVTYGLATYRYDRAQGRTVLLLAGNIGPAIQGMCHYLVDLDKLEKELCPRISHNNQLNDYFQVVFKVQVSISNHGLVRIMDCSVHEVVPDPAAVGIANVVKQRTAGAKKSRSQRKRKSRSQPKP